MRIRLVVATLCAFAFLAPAAVRASTLPMEDALAVSGLVNDRMHSDQLDKTFVGELPYAVTFWKAGAGHAAGAALLKKTSGTWAIVEIGSAPLDTASCLEHFGVPAVQAKALAADIRAQR
jgi:hypothetical protein